MSHPEPVSAVFDQQPDVCPRCGFPDPLDIVYGTASVEMSYAAELHLIVLANDDLTMGSPSYQCQNPECGLQF